MKSISLIFLMLIAFSGCAAEPHKASALAKIHGVKFIDGELQLQVISNGCTQQSDFSLDWQQQHLTVYRLKADRCRRMPHAIWLDFPLPSDIQQLRLMNPITQPKFY